MDTEVATEPGPDLGAQCWVTHSWGSWARPHQPGHPREGPLPLPLWLREVVGSGAAATGIVRAVLTAPGPQLPEA